MSNKVKNNYIIILLCLLFTAPSICAYFFYKHPSWIASGTINKGTLLQEKVQLSSIPQSDKWHVMLWFPKKCTFNCQIQLDKLSRVRLALGRKLYTLDQLFVTQNKTNFTSLKDDLKNYDFKSPKLSSTDRERLLKISKQPEIFIIDPKNYIVLNYPIAAKPENIYKDLKILLASYEIKKGK